MTKPAHSPLRFLASPRRIGAFLAALVVAGSIVVYATSRATAVEASGHAAAPPAPQVTVAPVEEKLVTDYEELTGRVDAAETVELRARVSGYLETIGFQAGQLIRQGDVLFTIDSREYRAQFELAQAQAEQARAQADVAGREAGRADELLKAAAISNEEAEARRSRAVEARAALAAAEARLASARINLDYTVVRAPIGGRVSRALVTPGNLVSGATVLTTIVSVGDAFVYADLDEATVLKFNRLARDHALPLKDGHVPVELQLGDEGTYSRRGYVESTDNRLDPATSTLVLRMVFPNADQALVPGLFARVRVPVGAPEPALLISERAIGTDQSQKFVLALENGNTAAYRTVSLGGTFEGKRIVRSGLRPGERIIINGLQRVRPGMTVSPQTEVASMIAGSTAAQLARR